MKYKKTISILVILIAVLSLAATMAGIFSDEGPGPYEHQSMEMVPQGIAQDVVTLGAGIPLLLLSLYLARKGSIKGRILLSGIIGYFLVTYLLYMIMVMYNEFFLVYVALTVTSFFALFLVLLSLHYDNIAERFNDRLPVKFLGGFLIFVPLAIGALWLSIVVPHLLAGTIPVELEHYTTLTVQGIDLGLLLPAVFVSGVLIIKKRPLGYLLAPVFLVFLSILMTALVAKLIGMSMVGVNVGPPLVVIPLILLTAIVCVGLTLKYNE
jgi:hypothetical protein